LNAHATSATTMKLKRSGRRMETQFLSCRQTRPSHSTIARIVVLPAIRRAAMRRFPYLATRDELL